MLLGRLWLWSHWTVTGESEEWKHYSRDFAVGVSFLLGASPVISGVEAASRPFCSAAFRRRLLFGLVFFFLSLCCPRFLIDWSRIFAGVLALWPTLRLVRFFGGGVSLLFFGSMVSRQPTKRALFQAEGRWPALVCRVVWLMGCVE